jgi:hypothetical protein
VAGVLAALSLAWWADGRRSPHARWNTGEPFERDPFEEDAPIFHDR